MTISGYACEPYDDALSDWRRVEMQIMENTTTSGARQGRTEVLWMSYGAEHELAAVTQTSLDLEARL